MQVQLDEEIWEMSDELRLEVVLANLSDRAQERGRLVTQLVVGEREMTDRDLIPVTLSQLAGTFGKIAAKSERLENIVQDSQQTACNFGQQLYHEAQRLMQEFRLGMGAMRLLDQWFGQMADYLEWLQIHQSVAAQESTEQGLTHWVNELIAARNGEDSVRIADLLEYEIIPRLQKPLS